MARFLHWLGDALEPRSVSSSPVPFVPPIATHHHVDTHHDREVAGLIERTLEHVNALGPGRTHDRPRAARG